MIDRAKILLESGTDWLLPGSFHHSGGGRLLHGHHTGTMVGIYAVNGGSGSKLPADFDWFAYKF